MNAKDMIAAVIGHSVDAPYTIEYVYPKSPATVWISGHYHLENGLIEDQLTIGLKTYFTIKEVVTTIEPDPDGWFKYSVLLTRRPAFAQVPSDVVQ